MSVAVCVEYRSQPVANLRDDPPETILANLAEAARQVTCKRCWYNCRGEIESIRSLRGLLHALPVYLTNSFKNSPGGSRRAG